MASKEGARRVARAQASGRGAKVRRQIPLGFYTAVVVIVVAGVASIGYSKYELDHPTTARTSSVQPAIGTTWHTAIGFDACGKYLPVLTRTTDAASGITSLGNGVLVVAPKSKSEVGGAENLARLPQAVPGLKLLKDGFEMPGGKKVTASSGCAGKPAKFGIYVWSSLLATKPSVYASPASVKLENDQVLAVAVLPKGSVPKQPPTAFNLASATTSSPSGTGKSGTSTKGTPSGSSSGSGG